jgi:hypothetical protein
MSVTGARFLSAAVFLKVVQKLRLARERDENLMTFATNNMDFSLSDFFLPLVSILVMATLTYMNFKLFSRTEYSYQKITKKLGNLNGCMMFMTVPF